MFADFKKFVAQGNVIDLAIAFIMGAAFTKIVTSLVNDIIMPLVGLAMNGVNVSGRFIALNGQQYLTIEEAKKAGVAVLAYGSFFQTVIDFLIVAFVLFLIVRQVQRIKPVTIVK